MSEVAERSQGGCFFSALKCLDHEVPEDLDHEVGIDHADNTDHTYHT